MKKIIIFIAIIVVGGLILFGLESSTEPENGEVELPEREIEFVAEEGMEAQEISVLEGEEIIFSLTIDELNEWTADNWDHFEEPPQVAMREVVSDGFGFFDRAASISPDNSRLIFSVSDYAAATTTSLPILVELETGDMEFIKTPARGTVEEYFWNEDSSKVAYTLGTGRSGGDYLRVDDIDQMDISFELEGEDLLTELESDIEANEFMPVFGQLNWVEDRLEFETEDPESDDRLEWIIDSDGENLSIK